MTDNDGEWVGKVELLNILYFYKHSRNKNSKEDVIDNAALVSY